MFLLVPGRHVGAHPDGHQHGVSVSTDYVVFTSKHIFQRIAEYKHSTIGNHLKEGHKLLLKQLIYKTNLQF